MKKLTNIFCSILLVITFTFCIFNFSTAAADSNSAETNQAQQTSTELNNEDWKIVLDDKKGSNEFSFIQKNLSSDLTDNGHFLLVTGIILIIVSIVGIIYFSIKLYKISPHTKSKKYNNKGNRYK